jgi:TPP-dependent pyruvate/acetoin dehydrogenase alpha subunit
MVTTEAAIAVGTCLQLCTAPQLLSGKVGGLYCPARGQEFAAASVAAHLEQRDYMVTTFRGVHDQIAKGAPLRESYAEYIGKVTASDVLGTRLAHTPGLKAVVADAAADAKGLLLSCKLRPRLTSDACGRRS